MAAMAGESGATRHALRFAFHPEAALVSWTSHTMFANQLGSWIRTA